MYIVSNVREREIYTAEPSIPEPSHFEVEIAIATLKKYTSPGSDQIQALCYKPEGRGFDSR
jgi:hypothetical protein